MAPAEFSKFTGILSTFTASAFRIWKNSAGIPSRPLALLWCFLRPIWLHILECLAPGEQSHHHGYLGHEDLFRTVFLCIFLISFGSVRSIPLLSFIVPIFTWNVPLASLVFLKTSLFFPVLLFSSIYLQLSPRKAFLSFLAILWNSAFLFSFPVTSLFSAICKASSDNHFAFLHFFLLTAYIGILFSYQFSQSCLLVGALTHLHLKVIIDKYDPIAIYYVVLGSSL